MAVTVIMGLGGPQGTQGGLLVTLENVTINVTEATTIMVPVSSGERENLSTHTSSER